MNYRKGIQVLRGGICSTGSPIPFRDRLCEKWLLGC